jgi:hypothetical protein
MKSLVRLAVLLLCLQTAQALSAQSAPKDDPPETVMATFYLKPDQADAFFKMMPEYWATLLRLNMVDAEQVFVKGTDESGKPIAVQIFSWKHISIPDNMPAEVQTYWTKMGEMTEKRGGHQPIEFPAVHIVPLSR